MFSTFSTMPKAKSIAILIISVFSNLLFIGCSEKNSTLNQTDHVVETTEFISNVIKDTVLFTDVLKYPKGKSLKLLLNRSGTEVRAIPCTFDGALRDGTEQLILASVPDSVFVGAGDSGSPLVTEDNRIVGILCYGAFGATHQFWARAISDVIDETPDSTTLHLLKKTQTSQYKPLPLATHFSGNLSIFSSRRSLNSTYKNRLESLYGLNNNSGLNKRFKSPNTESPTVIPGMSMALIEVSGDLANVYAVGTISYLTDSLIYAFGHGYNPALARQIHKPVRLATMKSMIRSSLQSFKVAQAESLSLGTLVLDNPHAVVVARGKKPSTISLETTTYLGDTKKSYAHEVSHDVDFDWECVMTEYVTVTCVDEALHSHHYRGWSKIDLSIQTIDTTIDSTIITKDTLSTIDTTTTSPIAVGYESDCGSQDDDISMIIAKKITDVMKSVVSKPFTLKRIKVAIWLYPEQEIYYNNGCWSLNR